MSLLAVAFLPLAIVPGPAMFGTVAAVGALVLSAALLAIGTAAVFPFEMDTVVSLADGKRVATHYGFYNTVVGVGILVGNLATGAVLGTARAAGAESTVWIGLTVIGATAAWALHALDRHQPGGHAESTPGSESDRATILSTMDTDRFPIPAGLAPPGRASMPRKSRWARQQVPGRDAATAVGGAATGGWSRLPSREIDTERTTPIPRVPEPATSGEQTTTPIRRPRR
jgi:hypothetical protein